MHPSAHAFVAETAALLEPPRTVLDLGGRDVNGTVQDVFPSSTYVVVDLIDGANVDHVADAAEWTSDSPFDCVVCCEVLEHTPRAHAIVANAARNLRAGGVLIITAATDPRAPHSGIDGGPLRDGEYYANINAESLEDWLYDAGFDGWQITTRQVPDHGGDLYAVAWLAP